MPWEGMERPELLEAAINFAIAILLGALVGLEREKRKGAEDEGTDLIAGLRTFTLFSMLGALAGWVAVERDIPFLLPAGLLLVGAFVLVGYSITARASDDTGLTTEMATLIVFMLGAMVMLGFRELAVALGIVTATVLAYKRPLHGFVAKLGWDDVFAGLRLLIASFIALPLLPDRTVDPWGALNPYMLWLLVILIAGLSLVGYVATRLLGAGRGIPLTGITGGLVSSTAVTFSFAKEGAEYPKLTKLLACGILLSWVVMCVRILVEVAVVNRDLLIPLLMPLGAMAAISTGFAGYLYFREQARDHDGAKDRDLELKNPFSLWSAAKFAMIFAVVLLAVKIVQQEFSEQGLYVVAAIAGTTDVDAITLSMAEYAKSDGAVGTAVIAIVIGALSNTFVKAALVVGIAGLGLGRPILIAAGALTVAGLGAALFAPT
ncbi:MgtC family protein [Methyloligella halotolerans]|uniref:MgtC family protein n=1 Tax=Methyloligella halotolerans TaxID=1177755 RepID=A0A1E2RXT8_9HYPH|nr:MgtC/SapB family protein [Methyloligella halotolerans]ODA66960.1 MgtC family protein [Methyloligella halotolerans]